MPNTSQVSDCLSAPGFFTFMWVVRSNVVRNTFFFFYMDGLDIQDGVVRIGQVVAIEP